MLSCRPSRSGLYCLPTVTSYVRRSQKLQRLLIGPSWHRYPRCREFANQRRSTTTLSRPEISRGLAQSLPKGKEGTDIEPWLRRLEGILPPELRKFSTPEKDSDAIRITPLDAAGLISEARRIRGHDLLLSFAQANRWRELVWLVTHLIDDLWRGNPINAWDPPLSPLSHIGSLEKFARKPYNLNTSKANLTQADHSRSIDLSVTDHPLTDGPVRRQLAGHQLLGQIWQSLGSMIIEDKSHEQNVQTGILEVIAVLHSRGVMPDSIYSYTPLRSSVAGTQPPTLHILSSQILTTLSDAVWKAREASAVEEAHRKGRPAVFMGPELPGSNYRVRVAGIRHEIWLELVLWSCLHGGWIRQGAAILSEVVMQQRPTWSPLSWREVMEPLVKPGEEADIDWARINYQFNTGAEARDVNGKDKPVNVERTISSEVISAYVESLVNQVSVGVGERGVQVGSIIDLLKRTKNFLKRGNFGLESTSWDAMVQRILESESIDVESAPGLTERVLDLSSAYGEDESTQNSPTRDEAWRPLAPYLVDGSAITLGVTHRVLKAYIKRGDFAGAFRTFMALQARTDENKKRSIAAFFRQIKLESRGGTSSKVDFSSPQPPASYPGLFTMLPVSVLAPFLDLITEVGAFNFGKWLLASHDVDGPVIGPYAYRDPDMAPAIIRFLAAANNEELLGQMLQRLQTDPATGTLPASVFIAILESQFRLGNSAAALGPVDNLLRSERTTKEEVQMVIALLAREVLESGEESSAIQSKLEGVLQGNTGTAAYIRSSIAVVLMSIDDDMKNFCLASMFVPQNVKFSIATKAFNTMLMGCAKRHGSSAARDLLCQFSPMASRLGFEGKETDEDFPGIVRVVGRVRPESVAPRNDSRTDFTISTIAEQASPRQPSEVSVTGRFMPDISSVRIILSQRLKEIKEMQTSNMQDGAQFGFGDAIVEWCASFFKALGMRAKDVEQEIEGRFTQARIEEE